MSEQTRKSFCQGYMDGRWARLRRANDGQCRWQGGRCAVEGEMVAKGDAHFNRAYALGFQAGWEDTDRHCCPTKMGDSDYAVAAMELAYSEHKMWEDI